MSPAAKKPFMCRTVTSSPVQRRLAGPVHQKLLFPSTLGVSDSTGCYRCHRGAAGAGAPHSCCSLPGGAMRAGGRLLPCADRLQILHFTGPGEGMLGLPRTAHGAGPDLAVCSSGQSRAALTPHPPPATVCRRTHPRFALTARMDKMARC